MKYEALGVNTVKKGLLVRHIQSVQLLPPPPLNPQPRHHMLKLWRVSFHRESLLITLNPVLE